MRASSFPVELRLTSLHFSYRFREPIAEFFGTMILLIFGIAVDCQVTLSTNTAIASSPKGVRNSVRGSPFP